MPSKEKVGCSFKAPQSKVKENNFYTEDIKEIWPGSVTQRPENHVGLIDSCIYTWDASRCMTFFVFDLWSLESHWDHGTPLLVLPNRHQFAWITEPWTTERGFGLLQQRSDTCNLKFSILTPRCLGNLQQVFEKRKVKHCSCHSSNSLKNIWKTPMPVAHPEHNITGWHMMFDNPPFVVIFPKFKGRISIATFQASTTWNEIAVHEHSTKRVTSKYTGNMFGDIM